MKKFFSNTNNSQFASTSCGAGFSCVNNMMDTIIMVSIIISILLSLVSLCALALIMAVMAAVMVMQEKVNAPKARPCS